jgi:iron complex outermembrane recepter protein
MEDMGLARIPGGLGLSVQGTWLDYYKTKQSSNSYDPTIDWKGSLGPNLSGFNGGAYDYRLLTSLSYNLPSWNFNLRWRHFPKVDTVARAQENGVIANNAAVTAGGAGSVLSYTPNTSQEVDQYNVFDLSGFWTINDTLTLRFGVDNVLDKEPSITTATLGRPYDSSKTPTQNRDAINAVCTGLPGCVLPTTYSLGSSGQGGTSGGYYDTLGRRYYVGLKARF